ERALPAVDDLTAEREDIDPAHLGQEGEGAHEPLQEIEGAPHRGKPIMQGKIRAFPLQRGPRHATDGGGNLTRGHEALDLGYADLAVEDLRRRSVAIHATTGRRAQAGHVIPPAHPRD